MTTQNKGEKAMKMRTLWCLAGVMALAIFARSANIIYSNTLTNETALAYNKTYVVNLQQAGIGALSAQAVYSSATIANVSFQDGSQALGNFTVSSFAALKSASASNNVTVASTSGLTNASITVPGFVFTNGIDWATQSTASDTAASLATALATVPYLSVSRSGAIVFATATAGSFYNSYAMTSNNTNLVVASANFTGGQDNASVAINGVKLTQGSQWTAATSNAATASSLATAINATAPLSGKVTAAAANGVVYATSTLNGVGYNYPLQTSNPSNLAASAATMTGGSDAAFALGSSLFTSPSSNGLTLALPILYTQGTAAIGGLANQTTYYAIPTSGNSFMLSKYSTSAVAGIDLVVVTSTNTQVASAKHTYTLSPLGISGTPSFKWQVSNDGSNWYDLAVASVTMSSYTNPPTNTFWTFGYISAAQLRLNVIAPTTGGISLVTTVVGTN